MLDQALASVARTVEQRMNHLFCEFETRPLPGVFQTPLLSPVLNQVRELSLRAGKRLRPALLIHGAALFSEERAKSPEAIDACVALELLHTYFLIHDDIMDGDETRRSGPSVHAALIALTGDRQIGINLGILAGDLAVALHHVVISRLPGEHDVSKQVNHLFATMQADVVHGQCLDILCEAPVEEIARRKTASYTTIGPLTIGSTLAGASPAEVGRLADLALPLGIAFQLRDDLLGAFGEPAVTGKPKASDLRNGKRTFLLEEASRAANAAQKRAIEAVFGKSGAPDEAVALACDALIQCGARAACERRIDALCAAFTSGIESGSYLPGAKQLLLEVARFASQRDK